MIQRAGGPINKITVEDVLPEDEEEEIVEDFSEEDNPLEPLSTPKHLLLEDNFFDGARRLRKVFDDRFKKPLEVKSDRFCWDYWHVENQYSLIRTPAHLYFPKKLYNSLEQALLKFGQDRLGCASMTPLWLSYYVDGCRQELHCDNPHGPWAFVFSLTNWDKRKFRGGETVILKPQVLDFWRSFDRDEVRELHSLVDLIEPQFNRLTVFDPRFPHGVRVVEGTRDPMQARIVIHGWFTDPSPFFTGALSEDEATPALNRVLEELFEGLQQLPRATGTVTVRMEVRAEDGTVSAISFLTDTLVPTPSSDHHPLHSRELVFQEITHHLSAAKFPAAPGPSSITIPFIFD